MMETAEIIKDDLIKEILEKAPDENDNNWFLKLSKQSQLDFIMNRNSDREINFNNLKIKTLIETNKILETMGKPKITKAVKELIEMMDNQVEHLNNLINTKKPLWKGGNLISSIESGDYEVKITVVRKSKSDGTK